MTFQGPRGRATWRKGLAAMRRRTRRIAAFTLPILPPNGSVRQMRVRGRFQEPRSNRTAGPNAQDTVALRRSSRILRPADWRDACRAGQEIARGAGRVAWPVRRLGSLQGHAQRQDRLLRAVEADFRGDGSARAQPRPFLRIR